ncbi:hypothetical protein ACNQGL_07695 [Flavobacterium sp. LB3P21]|uniref:hypothetical protein n=1 Tax=Flavobacterium sp. LB3P21 TaxID=3401719 RepID=UPI003AB0FE3F
MSNEIEKQDKRIDNGRPFKMQKWVDELKIVLSTEDILFLSDQDLHFLVNQKLEVNEQISKSTFEKWKAGKFAPDEATGKEFIKCIQYALIKQKQLLSKKMMEDTSGQWTRYAWIMERKFTEWNLKHISENINKNEQSTVIQITANSDKQKALIDKIIYSDFEEIKPIELENNVKEDDYEF